MGSSCQATVPSIVVENGSSTLSYSFDEEVTNSGTSKNQNSERENNQYIMSLGDEAPVSLHGPGMNNNGNMTSGPRSLNSTSVQSSVSPSAIVPVKQISLPALPSNRNPNKQNVVNRTKIERSLSKQEGFDSDVSPAAAAVQRLRNNPKVKVLQRSHAMREETSPPRESDTSNFNSNNTNINEKINVHKSVNGIAASSKVGNVSMKTGYHLGNSLQVNSSLNRPNARQKLRQQGSSQGSVDSSSPCLSRDSSTEQYTDNSGIDLSQFIADTINKNNKDRMLLLQIEQELLSLQKDPKRAYQKFPVMPSYQRMLVHRVAAFFGMDHNVDQTGNCVIVNVTPSTRIPDIRFSDLIRGDCKFSEEPRRCILKRDSNSFEEGTQIRSPERQLSGDSRRSKSFEEREEEYERARKRIFSRDDGLSMNTSYRGRDNTSRRNSHEDLRWQEESQTCSSSDSDLCNTKIRPNSSSRSSRMAKVESFEGHDTLKANSLKGSVSKSYSFGGYPGVSRGDSVNSSNSRTLAKQDSVTSSISSTRLSPSSSGYKSQSVRSDVTTSNRSSPNQVTSQCSFSPEPNTVLWAVSSINSVPPGAVLINPASGQPYTNPDGSLYRYDPDNPIKLCPTIEEDVTANSVSSHSSGVVASDVLSPEPVITERETTVNLAGSGISINTTEVTNNKPELNLRNSSTSPNLPESPPEADISKKDTENSDCINVENDDKKDISSSCNENSQNNVETVHLVLNINKSDGNTSSSINNKNNNADNTNSSSNNSNSKDNKNNKNNNNNTNNNNNNNHTVVSIQNEVAQNNFNRIESESNVHNDNSGGTTSQNETREYTPRNNPVIYSVNYSSNCNVQGEYGSQQCANGGSYVNSTIGVTSINYTVGPQYPTEPIHMPPEATMYSQQVVYASNGQSNPYGMVHTSAPAPAASYEGRPNESNPTVAVQELGNYFVGLNINNEQAPPSTTTPAPQVGYWNPPPNTSQTQGSNHSSQIQVYYLPGSNSAGTIHPKYTPATPSMYTYNVPPMVYPTEICQSVMPSATNAVFPGPYYPSTPNTTISYRSPTPSAPTAVAAAAVAPTSFFLYHPPPAAPPPPPPAVQFGMVRAQQQVPGIRSSPPPGPRTRMPHAKTISDRTRHPSMNMDAKTPTFHFSSPLSIYGLRFMPGEIQSIGMVRPLANARPIAPNQSHSHYAVGSQMSANESLTTAPRPVKPRKQR